MQPNKPTPHSHKPTGSKKISEERLIFGAIGLFVGCMAIGALWVLLASKGTQPTDTSVGQPAPFVPAQKLAVGSNQYLHACSVIEWPKTLRALGLPDDRNRQKIESEGALPPASVRREHSDLLQFYPEEQRSFKRLKSVCRLEMPADGSGEHPTEQAIELTIRQGGAKASDMLERSNQRRLESIRKFDDGQLLPSLPTKAVASVRDSGSNKILVVELFHNDLELKFTFGMGSMAFDAALAKADAATKAIYENLTNPEVAAKYPDFTNYPRVPYLDTCKLIKTQVITRALHSASFKPDELAAEYVFSPEANSAINKELATYASCTLLFAYPETKAAKSPQISIADQYSHSVRLRIHTYASNQEAQSIHDTVSARYPKARHITYGDMHGFHYNGKANDMYLVVKGKYQLELRITQDEASGLEAKPIDDASARKILEQLGNAIE